MKLLFIFIVLFLILVLGYFIYLGYKSQTGAANGIIHSRLTPCPDKPNCICSEFPDKKSHFIKSLELGELQLRDISKMIEISGGKIISEKDNYISATYTSNLFTYVDDLEVRIDAEENRIHFRSASRVGHSDMGVNLKRIQHLKNSLKRQQIH